MKSFLFFFFFFLTLFGSSTSSTDLQTPFWNFIKKGRQHRCFPGKTFLWNTSQVLALFVFVPLWLKLDDIPTGHETSLRHLRIVFKLSYLDKTHTRNRTLSIKRGARVFLQGPWNILGIYVDGPWNMLESLMG